VGHAAQLGEGPQPCLVQLQTGLRQVTLGDVPEAPYAPGYLGVTHQRPRVPLEHPPIHETNGVEVLPVRPVELLHLGREGLGLLELSHHMGQKLRVIAGGE